MNDRIRPIAFALALAFGIPAVAHGQAKRDGKDDVVGAIWSFKAVKGSDEETGQFRVYQKEVFRGARKVGVIKPKDNDETTLIISGYPKLNGTVVLRKTKKKPPVWAGVLNRDDGSKWKITVEIKDR